MPAPKSSPAHPSALKTLLKNSLLALASFIIIDALFFKWLDLPCAKFMHTLSTQTLIYKISAHIETIFSPDHWLMVSCIFILIGFGLLFNHKKSNPYFKIGLTGILAFIIAGVVKIILARYRPIEFFSSGLYGFHFFSDQHDLNSTPSGHTVMAVAVLGAIANLFKKIWFWVLVILICIVIAGSRLILNAHYISDLIFAAYIGLLCLYWVNYLIK